MSHDIVHIFGVMSHVIVHTMSRVIVHFFLW